jgi:hypothetical protein
LDFKNFEIRVSPCFTNMLIVFQDGSFFRWHPLTQTSNMAMAAMPVSIAGG